jgi:hypothetical protein
MAGASISARMSVKADVKQAEADLKALGATGERALKALRAAMHEPTAGAKALDAAAKDLGARLQGVAGSAGTLGSALSAVGPMGLAAAAGIGTLVAVGTGILKAAQGAIDYGASLEKLSKTTGLSTTFLQELGVAAKLNDIDIGTATAGIGNLNVALGAVNEKLPRSKQYLAAFAKLGFTAEDLAKYKSAEELFPVLADRMANLGDVAGRQAIAKKLGLEEMLPMLEAGANGFDKVAASMKSADEVLSPGMIQSLAQAKEKLNEIDIEVSTKATIQFAQFAGVIEMLKEKFAGAELAGLHFIGAITNTLGPMTQLADLQKRLATLNATPGWLFPGKTHEYEMLTAEFNALRQRIGMNRWSDAAITAQQTTGGDGSTESAPPAGGGHKHKPRGARKTKDMTEEDAADARDVLDSVTGKLDDAQKGLAEALGALTTDVMARAKAEEDAINAERNKQLLELAAQSEKIEADKKLTAAQKTAALNALLEAAGAASAAADARIAKVERERSAQLNDQLYEHQKNQLELQQAALEAQKGLALTLSQRRDLARAEFENQERLSELEIQHQIDQATINGLSAQQIADLKAKLAQMQGSAGAREGEALSGLQSPWQQWMADAQKATGDVNTALENVAAGGLNKFNQGLIDSQGRLANMRDLFRSVITDMITQLEQYLLKQAEIGLFSQLGLGGGAGGGGGGGGIPFLSMFLGGHADGGLVGYAGGGRISGPGGPRDDRVPIMASAGEYVVNARAAHAWLPVLDAINSHATAPRFASGGLVGSPHGPSGVGGTTHVTQHFDMSIHAPGADAAALQRVADNQEMMMRTERGRHMAFINAAVRQGLLQPGRNASQR